MASISVNTNNMTTVVEVITSGPQGPQGPPGIANTSSLATTGSNTFVGNQTISGSILLNNNGFNWTFDNNGNTLFPYLTTSRGDINNGNLVTNTLKLGDGTNQAVISTPDGIDTNYSSERLVINPGQGNGFGEGGDIYLWAGRGGADGGSGGDIKIRGGYGPETGGGGYVRIEGGNTTDGTAGFVEIRGGDSSTSTGGDVYIYGGFGNGGADNGNVSINVYENNTSTLKTWYFNTVGTLITPGNILLNKSFPLIYNNDSENNMLFGLFDGSTIYGAYYQVFGNQYSNVSQRGGAEFVYDTRNGGDANFHVSSFDGSSWTQKFRVDDNGVQVTGSLSVTGSATLSNFGTEFSIYTENITFRNSTTNDQIAVFSGGDAVFLPIGLDVNGLLRVSASGGDPGTIETNKLYVGSTGTPSNAFFKVSSSYVDVTGSVSISNILTLKPQHPLPSGVPTGSFAVSSSTPPRPYMWDGSSWYAL